MSYKMNTNVMDRRDFLKLGLLSTAGVLASSSIGAKEKKIFKAGGDNNAPLNQYVAKKFDHLLGGSVKGLSDNQLKAHFGLYENYIKKTNDLEARIKNFNVAEQDTTNYRGWHLAQTAMLNGAVLHELYFSNLGSTDKEPKGSLKKTIDRDFGSVQNFVGHLKLVGKVMHGWSIAALNLRTGKIHVYGLESHNNGVPAKFFPILVLDVYEHAYMIDYGTDRGKYLDVFVANLNWRPVQSRLEAALSIPSGESVTA